MLPGIKLAAVCLQNVKVQMLTIWLLGKKNSSRVVHGSPNLIWRPAQNFGIYPDVVWNDLYSIQVVLCSESKLICKPPIDLH